MSRRSFVAPKLIFSVGATALLAMAPVCTNSTWASTPAAHTVHGTHHESVSGTWSGSYSGSYTGTFKLTWKESNSKLSGTITISSFNNVPTGIHGTLQGTSIRFGTVGSEAITYSGSVAGNSMSGTWKIEAHGQVLATGSWKASKSS